MGVLLSPAVPVSDVSEQASLADVRHKRAVSGAWSALGLRKAAMVLIEMRPETCSIGVPHAG